MISYAQPHHDAKCSYVQQPQSVLIVDDELGMRVSLRALLSDRNLQIYESATGTDAIAQLKNSQIDLVLLDINLPDMSGLEVMEWIAVHRGAVGVIFVSADTRIDSAICALRAGAADFIRKPYEAEQLQHKVDQVLSIRRLERSHALMTSRLEQSERIHRFMVENSPDLIYTLDQNGCFTFVNSRFESMLGYMREELMGQPYIAIVHEDDVAKAYYAFNERRTDARNTTNLEVRLKCKRLGYMNVDSRHIVAMLSAMGMYDEQTTAEARKHNGFLGTYGVARDITERKIAEETIAFQAYHDQLTHLPNQRLFKDRLETALASSKRRGVMVGVMFIDLDRFKLVNDTYGHAEGDNLLKIVASRLSKCMRSGDTVARKGGDEFTVLMPELHYLEDANIIAEKVKSVFDTPFPVAGREFRATASIGIAVYPKDGETVDLLLKNADIAMYRVKSEGKNGYKIFSPEMNACFKNRILLENELRKAIDNFELELHFQPQVNATGMTIVGVEALVRWRHPEYGLISPIEFIPIAEESGLIEPITDWVLDTACRQLMMWHAMGISNLKMSVNVSPNEFLRTDICERILSPLNRYNLSPNILVIEITENILLQDSEWVLDTLKTLRDCGVHISIDDFGTQYSSLNYLRLFPVSAIKIDKIFVCDLTEQTQISPIIPAIIGIAKGFNLHLVAEGIETDFQMEKLKGLGCNEMQGYLFSRPLPSGEVQELLLKGRVQNENGLIENKLPGTTIVPDKRVLDVLSC